MKGYSVVVMTVLVAVAVSQQTEERQAIAVVSGPTGVKGNITFTQSRNSDAVTITGIITGLTKGNHGFHIHEKGDLREGCASTGGHFNPHKRKHGSPEDTERHIGDLGNIFADDEGVATVNFIDYQISLINSRRNILGRGIVIHADMDDLGKGGQSDSITTGHAGSRVACGIIGTLNPSGPINIASATTNKQTSAALSVTLAIWTFTLFVHQQDLIGSYLFI